jgi:hypothetical protein
MIYIEHARIMVSKITVVYAETVWHAITEFLLRAHASGLGHDAVIEIMIAILGIMVALVGLMLGAVGLFFAGLSIYGYQTIKVESKRVATKIAQETAAATITAEVKRLSVIDSTEALSDTENHNESPQPVIRKGRKTSDAGLSKGRKT